MALRIDKLTSIAEKHQVDVFLLTSAPSVKYFSGYYFYFDYGPSPFQLFAAALLVRPGAESILLIADNEMGQEGSIHSSIILVPYSSYGYESPLNYTNQFLNQLLSRLKEIPHKRIGIEKNALPLSVFTALQNQFGQLEFVDVTAEIIAMRAVKEEDEIQQIRMASALSDIGQAAVLKNARPGITELQLLSQVRTEMEATIGARVPLMADLSSGVNTASGGGMPSNKEIQSGDVILSDFTPCLNGYWGDSCNSMVVGKPSLEQLDTFKQVKEALEKGIDAIRPGVQALDIDRIMRKHIGNYPHHSGHGVGVQYHEEPRIVPYNSMVLQPNMVIALEPAIYTPNFGIRLEHLILVTDSGAEIITKFQHAIEPGH